MGEWRQDHGRVPENGRRLDVVIVTLALLASDATISKP